MNDFVHSHSRDIPETWPCLNGLITPMLHEESIVSALLREPLLPLGKASLLLALSLTMLCTDPISTVSHWRWMFYLVMFLPELVYVLVHDHIKLCVCFLVYIPG